LGNFPEEERIGRRVYVIVKAKAKLYVLTTPGNAVQLVEQGRTPDKGTNY